MKRTKIFALLCAASISAAVFTGCGNPEGNTQTESTSSASETAEQDPAQTTAPDEDVDLMSSIYEEVNSTRPLEEGDDYAINKINPKSPEGEFKGGYTLASYDEVNQGKLYVNDKSKIVIRAYNYKDDLHDMAAWADQACGVIRINNVITAACDTVFEKPEDAKVCGFDAIKYDYQIIQNEFVDNPDDPDGEQIKQEMYRFNARVYYFYSEQDAYVIMFDTLEDDWEEQSKNFEDFVADLEITKTEY